jgi:hypothetical protein
MKIEFGFLFLLIVVIVLYIETLLASLDNKIMGLILPIISFAASFIWLFKMPDFSVHSLVSAVFTLIVANIPTLILILIYRHKKKQASKH